MLCKKTQSSNLKTWSQCLNQMVACKSCLWQVYLCNLEKNYFFLSQLLYQQNENSSAYIIQKVFFFMIHKRRYWKNFSCFQSYNWQVCLTPLNVSRAGAQECRAVISSHLWSVEEEGVERTGGNVNTGRRKDSPSDLEYSLPSCNSFLDAAFSIQGRERTCQN